MTFASETTVKAVRKRHNCDGCQRRIEVGEPAVRWAGMTEGDFGHCIYHPDCRKAEIAYNLDILDCQHGDDWSQLSDIDCDDWPWLIGAFPAVAARMNLRALTPSPATACSGDADAGEGRG